MQTQLHIADLDILVTHKPVKNMHLVLRPPVGDISITAPMHTSENAIRAFVISKLGWIKKQQRNLNEQERETPREYIDRESHYLWGERLLLKVAEHDAAPTVLLKHKRIVLSVRKDTSTEARADIVERWYREQLRLAAEPLKDRWQSKIGVVLEKLYIQRMKTRWGSCNKQNRSIRLNTDLAKKPLECMEYILVHELMHLIETSHNDHFVSLMDQHLPSWRHRRDQLNQLPVRHADWEY